MEKTELSKLFKTLRYGIIIFLVLYILEKIFAALFITALIGLIIYGNDLISQESEAYKEEIGWNITHYKGFEINKTYIEDCSFSGNCVNVK